MEGRQIHIALELRITELLRSQVDFPDEITTYMLEIDVFKISLTAQFLKVIENNLLQLSRNVQIKIE